VSPSEFLGQDLFWWLQNRAPEILVNLGFWTTGKTWKTEIFQGGGSFPDSIQDLGILFSMTGQSVQILFRFF
jgi:hypothetical protein